MQANPLRAALERGELQIGTWVNLVRNPAILTLLKAAGLDFARVDMEHTAASMESIANMALLSRALNFPIAVRPPEANREWITRLLDCGVWNLHCPQVENAAHAAEIVAASRYAPRGLRGNAGHSPGTDYDMTGTAAERRAFANRQVFVTVMFETAAAFDDLDAIAAMDGIDALTIGPADLAQDLGVFGTPDQARVLDEKRDLVLAAAKKHGKTCAMLCSSYEQAQQWKAGRRAAAGVFERQRGAARRVQRGDGPDQGIGRRPITCFPPVRATYRAGASSNNGRTTMSRMKCIAIVASAALVSLGSTAGHAQQAAPQAPNMTFFVTSTGPGKGADLGGLAGADRQCQTLAEGAGAGSKTWRAYLSTQAEGGAQAVNARDRIGKGPWQNFKGEVVAQSVDELHGDSNKLGSQISLTERGHHDRGCRLHAELSRRSDWLADGRSGVSAWRGQDLPQLDEQHPRCGDGRPYRPQGFARRRRVQVVEFVASLARARWRLQPERSEEHRGQRPVATASPPISPISQADPTALTRPSVAGRIHGQAIFVDPGHEAGVGAYGDTVSTGARPRLALWRALVEASG